MSMEWKKALRVSADALAQAAQAGVTRALEARREAGVELSGSEIDEVSGGLIPTTIAGGITVGPIYPPVKAPTTTGAVETLA